MLKLFKQCKYLVCVLVYMTLYWHSWQGCHFLAHSVDKQRWRLAPSLSLQLVSGALQRRYRQIFVCATPPTFECQLKTHHFTSAYTWRNYTSAFVSSVVTTPYKLCRDYNCDSTTTRLRYDYDPTTIRLRRIARACFQYDASKNEHVNFSS